MFCAVTAIDRERRDTVRCIQYTFDFYLGKILVAEAILVHCGVVVPQFTIRGPGKLLLNFVV